MDIDADGIKDIFSGCYSRNGGEMAGLFWVLRGQKEGGFAEAASLSGTDGEPLIIPASKKDMIDKICTRPTAADVDADGDLDLVVGNFRGTFYVFEGKGKGRFAPKPKRLDAADGKALTVPYHSDPFLIDWDGDGDLDILSGSSSGGVFLARNIGSKKEAKFEQAKAIVKPGGHAASRSDIVFGEAHITQPQSSTRVYAADVNGDGKYDLIIGDGATVNSPGPGLDEATARAKYAEHDKRLQEVAQKNDEESRKLVNEMWKEGGKIVKREMTGFVWILYGK